MEIGNFAFIIIYIVKYSKINSIITLRQPFILSLVMRNRLKIKEQIFSNINCRIDIKLKCFNTETLNYHKWFSNMIYIEIKTYKQQKNVKKWPMNIKDML